MAKSEDTNVDTAEDNELLRGQIMHRKNRKHPQFEFPFMSDASNPVENKKISREQQSVYFHSENSVHGMFFVVVVAAELFILVPIVLYVVYSKRKVN